MHQRIQERTTSNPSHGREHALGGDHVSSMISRLFSWSLGADEIWFGGGAKGDFNAASAWDTVKLVTSGLSAMI